MSALSRARRRIGDLAGSPRDRVAAREGVDALRAQIGGLEARAVRELPADGLSDSEFRSFSQFGEDGIIQFLIQRVTIENEVFVEFGVEDYTESNTRFLLVHSNWRGLIIDAGSAHLSFVEEAGLDWKYQLDAVQAFIDRDNIDTLLRDARVQGDIGLLSVDIDGNDYWVFEAIESVSPRVLVIEYNSTWGPEAPVTVPYDPGFDRATAHPSHLYWGVSLAGITRLADRKGYALVGGNKAGNNAFFVRRDVLEDLPERGVAEVYRPSLFRESQGAQGERTYLSEHRDRLRVLAGLPLWDIDAGALVTVSDRYGI